VTAVRESDVVSARRSRGDRWVEELDTAFVKTPVAVARDHVPGAGHVGEIHRGGPSGSTTMEFATNCSKWVHGPQR